jgi:hypothetical protein
MLIRNATPEDLEFVLAHSISRPPKSMVQPDDQYVAMEHDGVVLAVGGFRMYAPGIACFWLEYSEAVRMHLVRVYQHTRDWLDTMIEAHELHRIEARVRPDFEEAQRLVEHLGFYVESVLKNGIEPGHDALMYVKLVEK